VYDIMTRLKVHHMREGGVPHAAIAGKCGLSLRSVERIAAERTPTVEEMRFGAFADRARPGRPSKASAELRDKVKALLEEEPKLAATEVLRRARTSWGYSGNKSAMSSLVKSLRPVPKGEPVVRFDGLPGEYAQFDHGEAWVTYEDGSRDHVIFFAGRLKYSRYMHVEVVENQQAEPTIRALIACIEAFGGSPKEWVFDNAKTLRLSRWGVTPLVLHRYLRDLVADYNVIPTFCAPRSGNQKGSVERLVGYTKHSSLFARKFKNREDLKAQLCEWLHQVNHTRRSDATGVIPEVARQEELRWLRERPLQHTPADHALREDAVVAPTGTVSVRGTAYFASARRIGAPASIAIRANSVEIVVGDAGERSVHVRTDGAGVVQRLPAQRVEILAAVHGRRKQATFRRQCILDLGEEAWEFLSVLVHRHPGGNWEGPCSELYELLEVHGDEVLRSAFSQCNARKQHTVKDVIAAIDALPSIKEAA
jgi:transposase